MSFRRVFIIFAAALAVALLATPYASAAPLSCDSDLQSFVTPGMFVATTSKYAIEKTDPGQPLPQEADLHMLLVQALDIVTQQARNLTSAPSANGGFIQSQVAGSTWEVTGDAVCVSEGAYGGAVVIYAPVVSTEDDAFVGFLPEGIHWKNATPQQFLPGDIDMLSDGNNVVIKRLSFYLLEPATLNPHLHLPNPDIRPKPGRPTLPDQPIGAVIPIPACDNGAPTYLGSGDEAQSLWRIDADPVTNADFAMVQTVGNSLAVFLQMPFPENSITSYAFLNAYLLFTQDPNSPAPLISPGAHVDIVDGPFCTTFRSMSATDADTGEAVDLGWIGFGHALNPDSDYSGLHVNVAVTDETATFWKVHATAQNTLLTGWVVESVARKLTNYKFDFNTFNVGDKISEGKQSNYYWLSPVDLGTDEGSAYMVGWQLNKDIEIGEPSTYSPRDPFGLSNPLPGGDCPTLPSRLTAFGGARVIVPALNVRAKPGVGQVVFSAGQNSVFRLLGAPTCLDGLRWWPVVLDVLGQVQSGWAAENDSTNYFLEPASATGNGSYVPRPTPVPTSTPIPPTAQPTNPPAPTAQPTATATDPTPG